MIEKNDRKIIIDDKDYNMNTQYIAIASASIFALYGANKLLKCFKRNAKINNLYAEALEISVYMNINHNNFKCFSSGEIDKLGDNAIIYRLYTKSTITQRKKIVFVYTFLRELKHILEKRIYEIDASNDEKYVYESVQNTYNNMLKICGDYIHVDLFHELVEN